jgi:hypothetical protein
LKEVKAGAEQERRTGTRAAKPPKFDRTTSWTVFRLQFKAIAEHNCWTHMEKSTYSIIALQG